MATGATPTTSQDQSPGMTYAQYSLMDRRATGELWSGDQPASRWEWTPGPDRADIAWGDPAAWPPHTTERFTRDTQWVYLLGFGDTVTGEFLAQQVSAQWIGGPGCLDMTLLPTDRRQRYARWVVPDKEYCTRTVGWMDWRGTRIDFEHHMTWRPPGGCSNRYYRGKWCIQLTEVWLDNQSDPGGPLVTRHDRDVEYAAGLGPGFLIQDRLREWRADLHHSWEEPR